MWNTAAMYLTHPDVPGVPGWALPVPLGWCTFAHHVSELHPWSLILVCDGGCALAYDLLAKFHLAGLGAVWALVISKVRERYPDCTADAVVFRLTRTVKDFVWLLFDFSSVSGFNLEGPTQLDAFIAFGHTPHSCALWVSTAKWVRFEVEGASPSLRIRMDVWVTTTTAEGAADETRIWRSRQRRRQFLDSAQKTVFFVFFEVFGFFWRPLRR